MATGHAWVWRTLGAFGAAGAAVGVADAARTATNANPAKISRSRAAVGIGQPPG